MTKTTQSSAKSIKAGAPVCLPESDDGDAFRLQVSFASNNPAPLVLVSFDGKVRGTNPATRRVLSCDPIGQQVVEVFPSAGSSIWQNQNAGKPVRFEQRLPGGVFQFTVVTQPSEQAYYIYGNDITERKQVEETLNRSLQTTRTILEKVPVGILVVGRDKIIRDINKTALEIVGKKKEDVVGQACHRTMCIAEIGNCPILDIGEDINNSERKMLNSDGNLIPILKTVIPVSISGEDVLLEAFLDITDRKRVKEQLSENEERFRTFFNSSSDAIMLLEESGISDCNSAALGIFGYENREELCSVRLFDLLPPNQPDGTDSLTLAQKHIATATEKGRANFNWVHQRIDGTPFHAEVLLTRMTLSGSQVIYAVVRDISNRIKREEEHARIVSQYMAMIDAGPAMMFLKDIDHRYVIANKTFCDFVNKPLDKIVGKTAEGLFESYEVQSQNEHEQSVMDEDRTIVQQEVNFGRSNETDRWYSTTTVPAHDQRGHVSGVVGLIQDITELHHSREQLVQADKMAAIGTLAAGVAHEINNPIGFIGSNLNTMRKYIKKISEITIDSDVLKSEEAEYLSEMLEDFGDAIDESLDGTERVRKIVADMKSFSRVDKSQKELFNLNDGLESTLNIAWNELKYNCTIEKNYGDIPELYCMPNQLNQVFMNLLVNAGHAMKDESGRITITTAHDSENIVVTIADTGHGIEQENLRRIFEPFFTTKDVGKGTGLGLSMAYDIIKKHGGQLDVTSDVGVGTKFTITLPLEGLERE